MADLQPKSPISQNFCSLFSVTSTFSFFLFVRVTPALVASFISASSALRKITWLTFSTTKKEESQMGNLNSTEEMWWLVTTKNLPVIRVLSKFKSSPGFFSARYRRMPEIIPYTVPVRSFPLPLPASPPARAFSRDSFNSPK